MVRNIIEDCQFKRFNINHLLPEEDVKVSENVDLAEIKCFYYGIPSLKEIKIYLELKKSFVFKK